MSLLDLGVPMSNFPQLVAETKADLSTQGIFGPIVSHAGEPVLMNQLVCAYCGRED